MAEEWWEPYSRAYGKFKKVRNVGMAASTAGGLGAVTGYAAGNLLGGDSKASAIAGGVAGVGLYAGASYIAHHPAETLESIGTPGYALGKSLFNHTKDAITSGKALNALEKLGDFALKGTSAAAQVGATVATQSVGELAAIAKGMIRPNPSNTIGYSLNTFGKVAVGAGIALAGIKKAFNTYEQLYAGTNDGTVRTATPESRSSTMNYAGATGDLNFAMYANRRG